MENYNDEFANKTAIITGAGQGMGKAVAERLAKGGSKIVVFDVNPDQAQAAIESLNEYACETLAVTGDVTKKEDVENITDLISPENCLALYFLGYLEKKINGKASLSTINKLRETLKIHSYWQKRFDEFKLSLNDISSNEIHWTLLEKKVNPEMAQFNNASL